MPRDIVTLKKFCSLPTPYTDAVHMILSANSDYLPVGLYNGDEFVFRQQLNFQVSQPNCDEHLLASSRLSVHPHKTQLPLH
jgi:hypothetical protein